MSLEEDLKAIHYEIRRLKVQYDLYFAGMTARPPNDRRDSLARQLRKYQDLEMRNLADRFLYNNVINKFNIFVELWAKLMRNKEEGARVHPLAARAAHRMAREETGGSQRPLPPSTETGTTAARAEAPAQTHGATGVTAALDGTSRGAFRLTPAQGYDESLRGLYEGFVAARREAGDARPVAFDTFAREVTRQAAAIKGKADCEAVEFRIYFRDNKVTIKARPSS